MKQPGWYDPPQDSCSNWQAPKMPPRVTLFIIWTSEVHPVFNWVQHASKQQQCKMNAQEPSVPTTENITPWNSLGYDPPQNFCLFVANGKIWRCNLVWQCFIISKTRVLLYRTHVGRSGEVLETIYNSWICTCQVRFVFNSVANIYTLKPVKLCALVRARVRVVCIRSGWGSRVGGVEFTGRIWLTRPVLSGVVCGSAIATARHK